MFFTSFVGDVSAGGLTGAGTTRSVPGVGMANHFVEEPAGHRWADQATSLLLFGLIVFFTWAFGGWPSWSRWAMNAAGYLLGAFFLAKGIVRRATGYRPLRWGGGQPAWIGYGFGLVTVCLLVWCLVSAWNARAVVDLEGLQLIERGSWVAWLPHSHDQPSTWRALGTALAAAGLFWGVRDWVSIASPAERRWLRSDVPAGGRLAGHGLEHRVSHRLRRLLWVICLNGGAVALVGIVSTLDDPSRMLWVLPHENREGDFFGPFYYRNHGAQFVNLIWPLCLALWIACCLRLRARQRAGWGKVLFGSSASILPICLVLMMAAPFISGNRGGSIIAVFLLAVSVPVLVAALRASRGILLLVGVTAGLGVALGLWLAWEPLQQRFFRDLVSYPTDVERPLKEFTVRATFRVPAAWGKQPATFAGLSDDARRLWNRPGTVTFSLRRPGVFEARFVETDPNRLLTLRATSDWLADAGRTVEIIFTHRAEESSLHLNGEKLELTESKSRAGFDWPEAFAAEYLWVGRGAGGSMKFEERIEAVTLLDWAMPDPTVRSIADRDPQPAPILSMHLLGDPWAELEPEPLVHVAPSSLSPEQWLASGLGGRAEIHLLSREMLRQYPRWLGSGPGTYGPLFQVFRQTRDPEVDWHAHDDHLQTRITFGVIGALWIYAGLLLCSVGGLCRGGVPVPWYGLGLFWIALAGALIHARFDWVFQVHPLLFLGIVISAVISACSFRPS
jgi:hypothetical protein